MGRQSTLFSLLSLALVALFVVDVAWGSVAIPLDELWSIITGGDADPTARDIVLKIRLTKAIVALLSGAALSASGLQMQTLFRNPLAGPYVLGVSSGASLGVAIFLLGAPILGISAHSLISTLGIAGSAWVGSAAVLLIIIAISRSIKNIMVILILGVMFSSAIASLVEIMQYLSEEAALKSFIIWTMGSLGDVTALQLAIMAIMVGIGLTLCITLIKALNILLMGEEYARTMGLNVKRTRLLIIISTVLLSATVTAFCGPIGFIGIAVPHLARTLFSTANHRTLMPATMLIGATLLIACDIASKLLVIPINTITALVGIPIVIFVVLQNRRAV